MDKNRGEQCEGGFTLVEAVVTITVITILTALVLAAFPLVRSSQRVQNDIHVLRSLVADAQQRALNEVREEECLDTVGEDTESRRRCSNVGVALRGNTYTLFADTDGNRLFSATDYVILERELLSQVTVEESVRNAADQLTFLFEASPPNVYVFVNSEVLGPSSSFVFTLTVGESSRTLELKPYGIIEDVS